MSARTAAILASKERCKRNRDNWKARALKAEAMCEWLAERLGSDYCGVPSQDGREMDEGYWLKAASEAVKS